MHHKNLKDFIILFLEEYTNQGTKNNFQRSLKLIEDQEIDNLEKLVKHLKTIILNLNVSNNTKNFHLKNCKTFLRWLSININKNYNFKKIKLFPSEINKRQPYDENEIELLEKELLNFNYPKFTIIWHLLKFNGLRLNEFVKIDWKYLKNNQYQTQILTSKNGRNRLFIVPLNLRNDFDKYHPTLSYNYIQNLFIKFKKYIYQKYPNFYKPIHAHMLRHYFINKAIINLGSIDKVQMLTGHINSNVLTNTYIKYNFNYQKILLEQVNTKTIESLEKQKLLEYIRISNRQIAYLKYLLLNKKN